MTSRRIREMERRGFIAIIILIIIFTIVYSGKQKKCYNCNSRESNTCASKPLESETIDCISVYHCVKCDYEMYNGTVEVERFCGILYVPFELATRTECNTCDTDLCNNANVMSINIVA